LNGLAESLKIGKAIQVAIYSEESCGGDQVTFTKDNSCFYNDSDMNVQRIASRVRSASVIYSEMLSKNDCIAIFSGSCYTGGRQDICNDVADLNLFNFETGSFILGQGVKSVDIFLNTNFEGIAYGIETSIASFSYGNFKIFVNQMLLLGIISKYLLFKNLNTLQKTTSYIYYYF
jgi:c-di-AMP phosphodiesterase-like protein